MPASRVAQIASLLLIIGVLVRGHGYALFLMFRVREGMRAEPDCRGADRGLGRPG